MSAELSIERNKRECAEKGVVALEERLKGDQKSSKDQLGKVLQQMNELESKHTSEMERIRSKSSNDTRTVQVFLLF